MDSTTINLVAANAIALLSPYLAKAAETVVPKAVEDLYAVIKERFSKKPAAKEALDDLEKTPSDADTQASARSQLKKFLLEDIAFARELESLLDRAQNEVNEVSIRADRRSVAAGGDVKGVIMTGDVHGSISIGRVESDDSG